MKRGRIFLRGALAALAVACMSQGASAETEQRCLELGNSCVCAESLNTNENITGGPPSWNPANSTTKQCTNFELPYLGMSSVAQVQASSAGVQFPSGANPYVHRQALSGHSNSGTGIVTKYSPALANVSNETVCTRHYFRYSSNASVPNDCSVNGHRIKIIGIGRLSSPSSISGIQHDCQGTGMYFGIHDSGYNGPDDNHPVSGAMSTCTSHWCRIEVCMDLSNGNLGFRGRLSFVNGPAAVTATSNQGSGPSSYDWQDIGMSTYTQGSIGSGYQFRSHHVIARVPVNSNFWIGPAFELEGGGGSNPPPPPPPAPVAPVLIQN